MNGNFNTCMGKLKMKHLPHDGIHTFASLMDSAGAIMMFLIINITLIFSLNHLEKHRMKCFKKSSKISKNECIPPVYHLCTTCI